MRKLLKILAGLVLVLVVIVAGAVAFAEFGSDRKLHRIVQVDVAPVAILTDAASLDRGQYLYKSRGCAECHGGDGAGKVVFDNGGFRVKSPHIAAGDGSVTASYKPEDWVRTIRHGLKPSGEPLLIMPSEDYARLTDADVGAIIG
jgi:mono/diheme cytochrome c family protein